MRTQDLSVNYADYWLGRFGRRAETVTEDVVRSRPVRDERLEVKVYVPHSGVISLPLHTLLNDPAWRNDAKPNKNMQCKILDDTFLAAPIYDHLQASGRAWRNAIVQSNPQRS